MRVKISVSTLHLMNSKWFTVQGRSLAIDAKSSLKMPVCEYIPSTYTGAKYENVKKARESIVSPSLKSFYKQPLMIHEGRGQWLWDHNGKRYLDMFAGVATVSVGHSHPKIVAAITEQASKLNHVSSVYMQPRLHEYATKLLSKFSGKLKVVYFTNSGSEANELAFLMARLHTRGHNIISLKNSYHGATSGTAASTAMSTWRYPFLVQPPGYVHVSERYFQSILEYSVLYRGILYNACQFQTVYPDVYKGEWGGSKCRDSPVQTIGRSCDCTEERCMASEKYFHEFEETFSFGLPCTQGVAAFVAESIQGIGGAVQYPKYLLKKMYDYVHDKGGVCIADEVQTGFGRTGEHFWGFENHGVTPDIVTMAKGIGNGFPLGAVVTTTEIAKCLNDALHFNTFGGNPLACAVGITVLEIIEEEGLQENARVVGTYLISRLNTLLSEFPDIVGDVRGKGLMIGVELISNPETKQPLENERMLEIFEDMKEMGVLLGKGGLHANVLRIKPPLCITKEDADFTVAVIKKALKKHRKDYYSCI
ncbi:alanine--glyoxylate aminotransferase 2, mitochondrial isoform X1 [Hylaeus volcanicus]|uniref:alanine--glyoxylate aminotransferase 2, mitochondrial isoform X1 n=1 Tax=Hylaeus volcanicus TaxID=313075 RepID=UPI0023B78438|nr:alanine--glyoxylate aminotransferase 2, mitochondrial isoform X1 [Hylaeus volcanicus]